ncbi:MAG: hypothetical protein HC834_10085 [Rhodospirillales bacterium]|nr:hypothetical protein [Rhodospirillales bacterium]
MTSVTKPASNNTELTGQPEPVLLILADISGYTRFMTSNAKSIGAQPGDHQ